MFAIAITSLGTGFVLGVITVLFVSYLALGLGR
jgi:hypothetical protein